MVFPQPPFWLARVTIWVRCRRMFKSLLEIFFRRSLYTTMPPHCLDQICLYSRHTRQILSASIEAHKGKK